VILRSRLTVCNHSAIFWVALLAALAASGLFVLLAASPLPTQLTNDIGAVPGRVALVSPAVAPAPPSRPGAGKNSLAPSPTQASGLPIQGDVTLGGAAGDVLVGLSLQPGVPGRNTVLVYVLPLAGEAAAAAVSTTLSVDGNAIDLQVCGPTCRSAEADLQGGERIEVGVGDATRALAIFTVPMLPAPDGSSLFDQMQQRMHRLQTYRVIEVLGPANPLVRTVYSFQAPDRMQSEQDSGAEMVWVGLHRYLRDGPGAPWQVEDTGTALTVPAFTWDGPDRQVLSPHIVGTAPLDGVETQVLAFFEQVGRTPIWFRAWIDAEGLVHRVEMRAQGHFMDHRYYDFDAPFVIEPPTS